MKKMDKEIAALVEQLIEQHNSLITTLQDEALPEGRVREFVHRYNLNAANFREQLAYQTGAIEYYIGERSDRWQESERGQAYQAWHDELDNQPLDEIDMDDLDEFDPKGLQEIDTYEFPWSVEQFL
ncbi:hypothetical protein [Methylopila sp. Yamaguchi]|uniref:hypothetical protein n=1 Tax=Methylopila sp. Yamaguchi TaxID=1437817 RepID=UPI000CB04F36|nr:hypothetical protein [Methylopila sp. Yamaguchi]GBD48547.1 hypothetical protein METY_1760 [Methylopila sp. Yamaguchi]